MTTSNGLGAVSEGVAAGEGAAASGNAACSGTGLPRYTLRPVVKPLPGGQAGNGFKGPGAVGVVRAESEDDDGYDPYSDVHDGTARALTFERDPWR